MNISPKPKSKNQFSSIKEANWQKVEKLKEDIPSENIKVFENNLEEASSTRTHLDSSM